MKTILEKADKAYWNGQPTGLTDAEFDSLAEASGYISKPSGNGWAKFPNYPLLVPNYGLKKIPYEVARQAVKFWPKWDGIYIEITKDSKNNLHAVTRGDGRTGKDLQSILKIDCPGWPRIRCWELCYSVAEGGRQALCRDLAKGVISKNSRLIPHENYWQWGSPPRAIETVKNGFPCDGYVVEFADGMKFKYKGE